VRDSGRQRGHGHRRESAREGVHMGHSERAHTREREHGHKEPQKKHRCACFVASRVVRGVCESKRPHSHAQSHH